MLFTYRRFAFTALQRYLVLNVELIGAIVKGCL